MYHLIIEHLGVKRCISISNIDNFKDKISMDCSLDHGCIPKKHLRDITIVCVGDKKLEKRAGVYCD